MMLPDLATRHQSPEPLSDTAPLTSLAKGLSALDLLRERGELGTNELAELLCINKSASSRILQTLASSGYARRVAGRRYAVCEDLAPSSQTSALSTSSVRPIARPLMEQLAQETNEAVYLGLFVDGQVLYVDKVVPERTLRVDRPVPTFSPLYCTAIGKIFVAHRQAPLPSTLNAYTPKTVTDPWVYAEQMKTIATKGYSWDDEEFNIGVRCVAAPLYNAARAVSAVLCLAAPSARLASEDIDRYGAVVKDVAATFSF